MSRQNFITAFFVRRAHDRLFPIRTARGLVLKCPPYYHDSTAAMTYRVDQSSSVSPSRQLVEAVLDGVAAGTISPGDKLLSVRALAAEALVNPNTAARAYRDLEAMGVVEGRNGRGVFVTPQGPAIARAMRVKATLDEFRRAAMAAVRAGHDPDALRAVLESMSKQQGGTPVPEVE